MFVQTNKMALSLINIETCITAFKDYGMHTLRRVRSNQVLLEKQTLKTNVKTEF